MKKRAIAFTAALMLAFTAQPTCAAVWEKDTEGWRYQQDDGTYIKGEWARIADATGALSWYYFDITGHTQTGWKEIGGQHYFFYETNYDGEESSMATGWLTKRDSGDYFFLNDGRFSDLPVGAMLKDGWRTIDGKEYYFGKAGAILQDANTPDGYYVNTDGVKDGQARKKADDDSYSYSSGSNSSSIDYEEYEEDLILPMKTLVRNSDAAFSSKKSALLKFISACGYRQSRFTITTRGIQYTGSANDEDVDQGMLDRMQNYMDGVDGAAIDLIHYVVG